MNSMDFPNTWRKFLQEYSFKDKEQTYTNGSELIPVFRVEQMIEHYLVEKQTCEYWYQGYYKLLGELANYKWISAKDRFKLPETEKTILVYSEKTGYILGRFSHYREFITNNGCPMSIAYLFDVHAYWCYLPEPPKGG